MWSHWVHGNLLQQQKETTPVSFPTPVHCQLISLLFHYFVHRGVYYTLYGAKRVGFGSDFISWWPQWLLSDPRQLTLLPRCAVSFLVVWGSNSSFCLFFVFWAVSCSRVLGPQPGIEPVPLVVKVWSLNHRTIREVLPPFPLIFLNLFFNWKKTALQYCDGFCHSIMQISHNCT